MASLWRKYFKTEVHILKRVYDRQDYEKTFQIPKMYLKWTGIQMTHKISRTTGMWWLVYYWFQFVNIFLALTAEYISMGVTASGGTFEDAIAIFRMVPCNGFCLLSIIKSVKMVMDRHVYENLIIEIGDMWPQGVLDEEEDKIISSALKQINFVVKAYHWCNNYLILSFLYPPFWELMKRLSGREWKMMLHFFYWLPFDQFQPVYYEIMLIVQTWHAVVVIWMNMCGDFLFCLFLSHITTQFDLLSSKINRLIYVPVDEQLIESYPLGQYSEEYLRKNKETEDIYTQEEWEEKHMKEITEIVLRHQALIRLSGDVENMFSLTLLVNVMNSSLVICFCGFCSVVVEKWNETAYKSFLVTVLSQTWFVCWYGQKLLDSSTGVAESLYNSGWYRASKKIRSSLLIMLHRAQKGVGVTTYGYSIISLASYTTIIKTAWSYFTLLLNFSNK